MESDLSYILASIALAIFFILLSGGRFRWHPFFGLLVAAVGLGLLFGFQLPRIFILLREGFGGLLGSVGLLIVLGSVIGVALERSGGAHRIAEVLLGSGTYPALRLAVLGALVSVPVFCDSGFIILAGLLPALARKSGQPTAVLALSLAGGLYLTHTLIPPTPGPLAAAANLGAEGYLGTIILLGVVVAIPVLLVGWRMSRYLGKRVVAKNLKEAALPTRLPSLLHSLLPILLPVFLIGSGSVLRLLGAADGDYGWLLHPTEPTVALLLGCVPALLLPAEVARKEWISDALTLAGPILIITGMGGAFGAILKASPLAEALTASVGGQSIGTTTLLLLGFGVAALLKTAQGSSTAALVITSSLLAPLLPLAGATAPYDLALLTIVIGGGAMTVSHANDSYFWVVTRFSGIETNDAYRSYTPLTGAMGLTVLIVTLLLSCF